ncbi:MAG: hypothetical protein MHM6MM_006935 [Cercozoa sp. M6MM]
MQITPENVVEEMADRLLFSVEKERESRQRAQKKTTYELEIRFGHVEALKLEAPSRAKTKFVSGVATAEVDELRSEIERWAQSEFDLSSEDAHMEVTSSEGELLLLTWSLHPRPPFSKIFVKIDGDGRTVERVFQRRFKKLDMYDVDDLKRMAMRVDFRGEAPGRLPRQHDSLPQAGRRKHVHSWHNDTIVVELAEVQSLQQHEVTQACRDYGFRQAHRQSSDIPPADWPSVDDSKPVVYEVEIALVPAKLMRTAQQG